jgi:hypothetical protein
MDLAYVVGVLLANRDLERRLAAENARSSGRMAPWPDPLGVPGFPGSRVPAFPVPAGTRAIDRQPASARVPATHQGHNLPGQCN